MNLRRSLTLSARLKTSDVDSRSEEQNLHREVRNREVRMSIRERILEQAQHLFAHQGYEKTTTKQLADSAHISEGTLFRYFDHKKDVLVTLVSQGWSLLLTDLLMELSEMPSDRAIAPMLRHWLEQFQQQADLFRVAFMEVQYHPELYNRIQTEVISKMTSITEAFIEDGITRGNYRTLNPRHVAHIFLSLFMMVGLEPTVFHSSPTEQSEFIETLADLFLNGILESDKTSAEMVKQDG